MTDRPTGSKRSRSGVGAARQDAASGTLDPIEKSPSDVLSLSISEGVTGPSDMVLRDGPDWDELLGDGGVKDKRLEDAFHRAMDNMDKELANYLRGGGTIKISRGFTKSTTVLPSRKK